MVKLPEALRANSKKGLLETAFGPNFSDDGFLQEQSSQRYWTPLQQSLVGLHPKVFLYKRLLYIQQKKIFKWRVLQKKRNAAIV